MALDPVALITADGQVVNSDGANAAISQILRGFFGDIDKVLVERFVPPIPRRVSGFQKDAFASTQLVRLEFSGLYRLFILDKKHTAWANDRVEGQCVKRSTILDK